jgi:hypothetical protein
MVIREPESKKRSICTAHIAMMSEPSFSNRSTATTSPSGAPVAATLGSRPLPASATGDHHKAFAPILPALPGVNYLERRPVRPIVAGHHPEFDYALTTVFEPNDSSKWAFCA